MPFIPAAAIPLIGAITGAVGTGAGIVQSVKQGRRSNKQQTQMDELLYGTEAGEGVLGAQQDLLETQTGAIKSGVETAEGLTGPAGEYLTTSGESFGPAIDFWSKILSGDDAAMTSVLSPEISRIQEGYRGAADETSRYMPRGGARSAAMVQLPYKRAGDISDLFSRLRPVAANAMTDIGSRTGAIGTGLYGNILGALSGAGQGAGWTGRNLMDFSLGSQGFDLKEGQMLGTAIGQLAPSITPLLEILTKKDDTAGGAQSDEDYWNALSP